MGGREFLLAHSLRRTKPLCGVGKQNASVAGMRAAAACCGSVSISPLGCLNTGRGHTEMQLVTWHWPGSGVDGIQRPISYSYTHLLKFSPTPQTVPLTGNHAFKAWEEALTEYQRQTGYLNHTCLFLIGSGGWRVQGKLPYTCKSSPYCWRKQPFRCFMKYFVSLFSPKYFS